MTFITDSVNHYSANSEFRLVYSGVTEHFFELEAFLKHIHGFVSLAEGKLGNDLKLYSSDFFEYYYARSYGETFRSSFIVTVCSVSEAYIKAYVLTWKNLLKVDMGKRKPANSVLDYLKIVDKDLFSIGIDFSKRTVEEFRALLYVRNSLVHSSGNLNDVSKYEPLIRQLARNYTSLHVSNDGFIWTDETFCQESMNISKRFLFYIFSLAIRKFPNYKADKTEEDF